MKKFLGERLIFDWKIAVLVVVSTLVLIISFYHTELAPWAKWFPGWSETGLPTKIIDHTLLYFVLPMLIILLVFRQKPAEFGFSFGDWKTGIPTYSGRDLINCPGSVVGGPWKCCNARLL